MLGYELLLRPLLALLAGALVGLERSYRGRAAGLRTYALVCLGSALLVVLAEELSRGPAGGPGDSTRVIQGIVTGIGFLGAGVIVKEGFSVRGLTTAASIWVISAVGVVIGAGFYVLGAIATALTLALLSILRAVEDRLPSQSFVHCHLSFRRDQLGDEPGCAGWLPSMVFPSPTFPTGLTARPDRSRQICHVVRRFAHAVICPDTPAPPNITDFKISPSRDCDAKASRSGARFPCLREARHAHLSAQTQERGRKWYE
jgi:putative Mg2+ transporter-C (MgtC) family protein